MLLYFCFWRVGKGGVAHGSRELKSKIHGSRKLKQTIHESSTNALIFHPYNTTGLTCWTFCMIITCTLNNCFSRSNTKFTLIHKCMLLPTHQDGVENRDKANCHFASPICDYLLFNRKKYKVNYCLGMKDMLRDIDARSCKICNYCNRANLAEPFLDYWTWIFLHPTAPGYLLHRPCYHLVLFLSGIDLHRFWTRGLVFKLPSWGRGLHVLLRALQTLARTIAFPIKEYASALCYQQMHSLKMLLDPHNKQHLPKLGKRFTRNRKQTAVTIIHRQRKV